MYDGGGTPAMGMTGPTAVHHPVHGDTSQGPLLPPVNPDDGGYDGRPRGGGKGRRSKVWLLAVLAVVAIAAGVAFALNKANETGGTPSDKTVGLRDADDAGHDTVADRRRDRADRGARQLHGRQPAADA